LVEIRALLPVHLNVDEPLVHQLRDCWIGVDGPLGDMAPIAGAVADREEDQSVLPSRLGNGFLAPRIPVNRIVGVLQEIRTGGAD
jgi:hypothetical protein